MAPKAFQNAYHPAKVQQNKIIRDRKDFNAYFHLFKDPARKSQSINEYLCCEKYSVYPPAAQKKYIYDKNSYHIKRSQMP